MEKQMLAALQTRLKALGYYHGFIDGVDGAMTQNAVIEFKRRHGLTARAFVGPITLMTLFSKSAKKAPKAKPKEGIRPALAEARRLLGVKEFKGGSNNPVIMKWAKDLDQWYSGDDVPWCGLFVAHCEAVGSPDEPQDFNRLGARAWLNYGVSVRPQKGAVAVFWRTHPTNSYNGHVGYIVGEDKSTYHILGGNQSDSVSVTRVSKKRLLGCRAPKKWAGSGEQLASVTTSKISTNEA